jgi:hypothetical protein
MGIMSKVFNHGLPNWARLNKKDGFIEVDPDIAYPYYLGQLNLEPSKTNLEKARHAFTAELLRLKGPGLSIRILTRDKRWALENFN